MALASGVGVVISLPAGPVHALLFGEDQARYLLAVDAPDPILAAAATAVVPAMVIGRAEGDAFEVEGLLRVQLAELRAAHEAWLPQYMA
jgi:phosphoribosylformylglycinamidine synthase